MAEEAARARLASITAVFDRFHRNLAGIPDRVARELVRNWESLGPLRVASTPGANAKAMAIGLEQRLWDLTVSVAAFAPDHRAHGARALFDAIEREYPAFLDDWQARLDRILQRGKVRNESDRSLLRATIDLAQTENADPARLARMQELLLAYGTRSRPGG